MKTFFHAIKFVTLTLSSTLVLAHSMLAFQLVPVPGVRPGTGTKESLSTPSLDGSDLKPSTPEIGQIDKQPTFTRELLRLQHRANDPMDLVVVLPKIEAQKTVSAKVELKPAAKIPAILYIYNYNTDIDRFMRANICEYYTRLGVAAVAFPTALSMPRFHDRSVNEWFVSDLQEALATSAHDVLMVLNYLETRNDIDMDRIGIYGQGSGAAVAVLAAAVDPRIKVLDLEDTWGDWPDWIAKSSIIPQNERANYLKPAFLKSVSGLDPVDYLPKLKIPVRSQYSRPQSAVPPEVRKRIEAALPAQAAHTPIENNFDWINKQLARKTAVASTTASR